MNGDVPHRTPEQQHWHVEGKDADGRLLYSATVAAESSQVSGAPAAIAYACDRLLQNGYDARIVITWVVTLYCPGVRAPAAGYGEVLQR